MPGSADAVAIVTPRRGQAAHDLVAFQRLRPVPGASILDLTGGHGAEAVIDFVGVGVGEGGATRDGVAVPRRAGDHHVVGYGENIDVPTIDIISAEIDLIGNLVGSCNDLCELMVLAAQGEVAPHTRSSRPDERP